MPLFHFATYEAQKGREKDSCELPDIATARSTAVTFAGDVLREQADSIFKGDFRVIVTNESGELCWDLAVVGNEGPGVKKR